MQGKKNDFSVSFYDKDGNRTLFLKYVHNTKTAINWANSKGIIWKHCNVYERRTEVFIEQIKNANP